MSDKLIKLTDRNMRTHDGSFQWELGKKHEVEPGKRGAMYATPSSTTHRTATSRNTSTTPLETTPHSAGSSPSIPRQYQIQDMYCNIFSSTEPGPSNPLVLGQDKKNT